MPTGAQYNAMSPEQRFALRGNIRKLPEEQKMPWIYELKYQLDAGLTYGVHRAFNEEKDNMDKAVK